MVHRPLRVAFCAAGISLVAAQSASAAILTFTDPVLYEATVAGMGRATESFDGLSGASGAVITGAASGAGLTISWSASSTGGVSVSPFGGSPALTAGSGAALTLSNFGVPTMGISGSFFGRNGAPGATSLLLSVTLDDGTTSVSLIDATTGFVGIFTNSGATFSSLTLTPQSGSGSLAPVIDNLNFAVLPAPGAVALLGLAGLARSRRRG
ncbi:MAG: hypothetical protein RLZZ116_799 [Planctomycetota bacterium]|jgi:hypothetical protein